VQGKQQFYDPTEVPSAKGPQLKKRESKRRMRKGADGIGKCADKNLRGKKTGDGEKTLRKNPRLWVKR